MASSDIRAGRAFVEVFTKNNASKELDKIGKQLKAFGTGMVSIGKTMIGAGLAITAPLVLASVAFAKMGKEMELASERTGVAVESLSGLSYAAGQSGASLEDLVSALTKMEKNIFTAAGGSEQLQKALTAVGVTVAELKAMKPDERFLTIADALSKITEESTKTGLALEIFGKGSGSLIPLFNGGAAGARALVEHARDLGIIMSGPDAQAAKAFANTLDDLTLQFKMVTFQVGAAIGSALQPFATSATKIMRSVIDWTKANKPLIVGLLTFGAALVAGGTAVVGLGAAIVATGAVISGTVTVLGVIGSALSFLMSPIVLVIGGLTALAGYFAYTSGVGGEALLWLGNQFDALADIANESFGAIADALAAGDISLAVKSLWTGMKLAWAQGTQTLKSYWYAFKDVMIKTAADTFYGAAEIWENAKELIKTSFVNTTSFLSDLWGGFVGYFSNAWDNAVTAVAKGLNLIHGLWDKTFDAKAANATADAMLAANEAARRQAEAQGQINTEADRKKAVDAYTKAHDDAVTKYSQNNSALDNAADQNMIDDSTGDADQINSLHTQLRGLRSQAKRERSGLKLPDKPKLPDNDPIQGTAKSSGIFNIAALASLQSATPLTAIAKYTKQTADNTKVKPTFG